jgi:hypothetical protein
MGTSPSVKKITTEREQKKEKLQFAEKGIKIKIGENN